MADKPELPEEQVADGNQHALREAQPIDTEEPPRLPFAVVGIGASAGGLEAVSELLSTVRPDSGMAYIFLQHLPPTGDSMLPDILSKRVAIPVLAIEDQMPVEQNHLYCARPARTLIINDGRFHLGEVLSRPMGNRPVDDFFKSLAQEQRERAVGILLSGMGSNGTAGAQAIKAVGGLCIAQEPETAQYPSMPRHLIEAGYADYILRPADMPDVLLAYAGHPYASGEREEKVELAKRDQQHLREILAVLRTRTRQDFNGYKKPTVLHRVQRRMGINRLTKLRDCSKMLRQNPMEVTALSDDLLIHVTGFFRDPQAWETLRKEVIVPLVQSREPETTIRCWVTACSSGEEAYSLAMLLVEECDRISKSLDIKVFATDKAERTLQNARAGVFPGGIEAEIEPARLVRFFQKEDAVYRVRQDLREKVVFAPQNLLHDPPFSRLDIATWRNLLIYLEPPMQQRILSLLHFGLREGGILFLGTSEMASNDDLFNIVDKKARIYRRVGPTRHSSVDFPIPRAMSTTNGNDGASGDRRTPGTRVSIAQLTARALLEQHTPAAVTIDRDYRIVFFHGNLDPFVSSPRGEPTRNLMELARESVRGTVRTAVHRAMSSNTTVMVRDGWLETTPGNRVRIEIVASPLERKQGADFFVVSFQERTEYKPEGNPEEQAAEGSDSAAELRRTRDDLQSTIEELQTSNEELKASKKEVVSTNEELQSSNEELETSREEMQSLNEELSTVNSQLHSKMEEHQAASNDLASLLSSTDIAVLFLDTKLRIRRFTAAMRRLMDLIPSDSGRPINDMARKFSDPHLLEDAQSVSDSLVPIEREIEAEDHHWYLRRVLPYRTVDNHIEGLVITFVDITERRRMELALRQSEARLRAVVEQTPLAMAFISATGEILFRNIWFDRLWGRAAHDITAEEYSKVYEGYHLDGRPIASEEWPGARAVLKGETVENELYEIVQTNGSRLTCWFAAAPIRDASDAINGGVVLFRDVTDEQGMQNSVLQSQQQQQAFLLKLSDSIRQLTDRVEIQQVAMGMLGEHLNVSRAFYFLTEPVEDGDWYHIIETEYRRDPAAQPSFAGRHSVRAFSDTLFEGLHLGKVIEISDITTARLTPTQRDKFKAIDVVSVINVPLIKGRDFVGGITVHDAVRRKWTEQEIELMREVAARVEAAVERVRAQTALHESEAWVAGQKEALQAAIDGAPLADSLGVLARVAVEQFGDGSQCGFYLADHEKGKLYRVAGMSDAFAECVDGVKIGPDQAGCGLAVHTSQPVITADALNSKRWVPWRWLAEKFGFRGVWSFPIETKGGKVVGTFALYFPMVREPTPRDHEFAAVMGRAAGIIISRSEEGDERKRVEVALLASQQALAQAKRHSDAALLAAEMATFWWDSHNDRLTGDKNFAALIGQSLDETHTVPLSEFVKLIHPQDLARVRSAMDATLTDNAQFSVEFRLRSLESAVAENGNGVKTRVQEKKTNGQDDQTTATEAKPISYPDAADDAQPAVTTDAARSRNDDRDRNDGYRWFVSRGTVYRDTAGQPATWVGAVVDITERKQAEEVLRRGEEMHMRLRGVAEESNRQKDDFLATLSHELRTPLSSILLWTQLLRQKPEAKAFVNELNSIFNSAQAQKTLIEDLLDMSRIINGTLRLRMRELDLAASIRQSITEVSQSAKANRIELRVKVDKGIGRVQADPDRIGQIVWNLLNNAFKFTPEGGRIDLTARRPDGHVEISVSDSGIGIAPEFLPHIFERFRQADSAHSRSIGGLGLGLAIVKQLVELHGGTIEAQSEGVNRGATFTIKLPLPKLPDHGAVKPEPQRATDVASDDSLQGLMVLLVEDDKETCNALSAVLTTAGLQVIASENADDALLAARNSNPDLIISDIDLPGKDGYALIREIRHFEAEHLLVMTPALALTAFAGE